MEKSPLSGETLTKGMTDMKWMIASDLHGSADCCERLFTQMDREKAERMLLLGDLLYHGPRNALPPGYDTKRVAELLNERRDALCCVRGNCDTEVDQTVLQFPILAEYALLCIDGLTVFATHGHRYNREQLPPLPSGSILLHGHTHIPEDGACGSVRIMNPGSVSIPKGGSANGYMIYENGSFIWKTLDGTEFDRMEIKEML